MLRAGRPFGGGGVEAAATSARSFGAAVVIDGTAAAAGRIRNCRGREICDRRAAGWCGGGGGPRRRKRRKKSAERRRPPQGVRQEDKGFVYIYARVRVCACVGGRANCIKRRRSSGCARACVRPTRADGVGHRGRQLSRRPAAAVRDGGGVCGDRRGGAGVSVLLLIRVINLALLAGCVGRAEARPTAAAADHRADKCLAHRTVAAAAFSTCNISLVELHARTAARPTPFYPSTPQVTRA